MIESQHKAELLRSLASDPAARSAYFEQSGQKLDASEANGAHYEMRGASGLILGAFLPAAKPDPATEKTAMYAMRDTQTGGLIVGVFLPTPSANT